MTLVLTICCALVWLYALRMQRRLRLVALAEHELRRPLTAIALGLETMAWMDPRLQALLEDVARARTGLVDLDAARAGRSAKAEAELVQLDRVVWRAVTGWDLTARRNGGGVHLDWAAGPVAVRADRGRLAQALGNLLSNAVEHGGGKVRVIGRRTSRGVRIEVRDSGRGHGLAIATRAVRDAGGSLTAAKAGAGTAFTVDLPVADAEPPAAA